MHTLIMLQLAAPAHPVHHNEYLSQSQHFVSLSFSFIGDDLHASEEGGTYSYNQTGTNRNFILSCYKDLQV